MNKFNSYFRRAQKYKYPHIYIFILAFLIRIINLGSKSYLTDETLDLITASREFAGIIDMLIKGGYNHPPFHFLLYSQWVKYFALDNLYFLRLYSVLFSSLSIVFFYLIFKLLTNKKSVIIFSTILLITSPLHIFYAQNLKINSFAVFLLSVSLYYLLKISRTGFRNIIIFTILCTICFYSYYFLPAIIIFAITYEIFRSNFNKSIIFSLLLPFITSFILFLPWCFQLYNHVNILKASSSDDIEIVGQPDKSHKSEYFDDYYEMTKKKLSNIFLIKYFTDLTVGKYPFILYQNKYKNISEINLAIGILINAYALFSIVLLLLLTLYFSSRYKYEYFPFYLFIFSPLAMYLLLKILGISNEIAFRFITAHHFLGLIPFLYFSLVQTLSFMKLKVLRNSVLISLLIINLLSSYEVYISPDTDYKNAIKYILKYQQPGDIAIASFFGAGEKLSLFDLKIETLNYINLNQYAWFSVDRFEKSRKYGVAKGRKVIIISDSEKDDDLMINNQLLIDFKPLRVWLFKENGIIGDMIESNYQNDYIVYFSNNKLIHQESFFNLNLYCFELNHKIDLESE